MLQTSDVMKTDGRSNKSTDTDSLIQGARKVRP